jgi:methionine synthase I (cobalamin-dependent)
VEISRRAAGSQAQVFGSIGPSGKLLVAGDITADELLEAFAEQARALALAGADALLIETMSDIDEALVALAAARSTNLPVAVTMVFDTGQQRDRTMMGTTPEDCARALTSAGADIIGANCGQGIEGFVEIGRRLRSVTDRPLWIKANAGMPQLVEGNLAYPGTPAEFASFVKPLVDVGVTFIGGCCGTTPEFIAALRDTLPIALAIAQ